MARDGPHALLFLCCCFFLLGHVRHGFLLFRHCGKMGWPYQW
jgi:hypothetical protein